MITKEGTGGGKDRKGDVGAAWTLCGTTEKAELTPQIVPSLSLRVGEGFLRDWSLFLSTRLQPSLGCEWVTSRLLCLVFAVDIFATNVSAGSLISHKAMLP